MNDHQSFLRAIVSQPDDAHLRLVYADWLEERGDARADFLRLDHQLHELAADHADRAEVQGKLEELRAIIGPKWLALLDRTPIENCDFHYQCPLRWEKLQTTADSQVRFCGECRKNVHYCSSVAEARVHAWQGDCVALDSRLVRAEGDLEMMNTMTMGILIDPAWDSENADPKE